jgi:hypothetical protein
MANDAVARLQAACDNAFIKNPKSCSNAVWDVIRAMVSSDEPYRTANALVDHMDKNWTEVTLDKGLELANQGIVVVGGKKELTNGHVVVIYPGPKQASGGYPISFGGKTIVARSHGNYPLAMSTSLGSWVGAMSDGTKTVWDPWANDQKFAEVRFWTPRTP